MGLCSKKKKLQMTKKNDDGSQIDRFKELARELSCDEDEAAFENALKKIARQKLPIKAPATSPIRKRITSR